MAENARLVIWDLDGTFWNGTITEGGHQYIRANHEIVVELARRGIISSICSKNEFQPVRNILEQEELWSYFVFPSINWEPKGPRIAELIEATMFRPKTVLLIDDNPTNLNEAKYYTPGLQVAGPEILATILDNPLFSGREDRALTRLAQYKLLERRHVDESAAIAMGGTNYEFLRTSNIRVNVDFDIGGNIDRAVELVNRTNQLNFTKLRLSEDPAAARTELLGLVRQYDIQAGLIHVVDNYGDYGYVGFYAIRIRDGRSDLEHYCFSCRTLGMAIETSVYRRIGRPWLPMVGEVLSDPRDDTVPADWITYVDTATTNGAGSSIPTKKLCDVVLRGGCEIASIAHYFVVSAGSVNCEAVIARNGVPIRLDHSLFLTHALYGIAPEVMSELEALGYRAEDFTTRLFDAELRDCAVILSFQTDSEISIYRHKSLGFRIPFVAPYHFPTSPDGNVMDLPSNLEPDGFTVDHWVFRAIQHLRESYEYEGVIGEDLFKDNLNRILAALPTTARIFLLSTNEKWLNPGNNLVYDYPHHTLLNRWVSDVAGRYPAAVILDIRDFVHSETEVQTVNHFERMVYFRIYQGVVGHLEQHSPELLSMGPRPEADRRLYAK